MNNNQRLDALEVIARDAVERAADNAAAILEQEAKNRPPVMCLGMDGSNHVLYSTRNKKTHKLPAERFRIPNLLELAERKKWESWLFPERVANGEEIKRWELEEAAQEKIFAESARKTFDATKLRARGIWNDIDGGWIYNTGGACWHIPSDGGKPVQVDNVRGLYVYSAGVALPEPVDSFLTDEEGEALAELLTARTWQMQGAGELLSGWVVAALLSGVVPMSPHVWINAPQGTGKTKLQEDIKAFLQPFAVVNEGVPTEAAARQRLKGDALPWINDEMEVGDNKTAAANVNKVLDLMRSASYGKSPISKGGVDGNAKLYPIKCSFALFSVENHISRDSDSTRCIRLNLIRCNKESLRDIWQRQERGRSLIFLSNFHSRLITRLITFLPLVLEQIKALTDYLRGLDGVDARRGELFAVLLACRHVLTSTAPMTAADMEHAADILRAYNEQEEKESDSSRCLSVLLGHQIDVSSLGRMTVARACINMRKVVDGEIKDSYRRALELAGLRWRADLEALQVDTRAERMKRIFRDTQWSNGRVASVLAEGADRSKGRDGANAEGIWYQQAKTGGASPSRCVMIPSSLLMMDEE